MASGAAVAQFMAGDGAFFQNSDVETMEIQGGYLCGECTDSTIFYSMYDLQAHHHEQHVMVRFGRSKCSVCETVDENLERMMTHLQSHYSQGRRYECLLCGTTYSTKRDIALHLRQLHEVAMLYSCIKCGESFPSALNVIKHAESRHNNWLQTHGPATNLVLEPGPKEYIEIYGGVVCGICTNGVIFETTTDLTAHHFLQHGATCPLKFMCSHCSSVIDDELSMQKHMVESHLKSEVWREYICLECRGIFSELLIMGHLKNVHNVVMLYSCRECRDSFPSLVSVIRHAESMHNELLRTIGPAVNLVQPYSDFIDQLHEVRHNNNAWIRMQSSGVDPVPQGAGQMEALDEIWINKWSVHNFMPQRQNRTEEDETHDLLDLLTREEWWRKTNLE